MIYVSDNRITEKSTKRALDSALKERQERQISTVIEKPDLSEADLTWVLKAWQLDEHDEIISRRWLYSRFEKGRFKTLILPFNPDWERQYAKQETGH